MNALDILQYGNLTFMKTVQAVPQNHRDEPGVTGIWSVKDIIAHLASFEILLIEVLSSLSGDSPAPTLAQFVSNRPKFNDDQVLLRKHRSAAEVLAEYEETHSRAIALAAQIPPEVWGQPGTLAWYGAGYSLDDFIVYQYYGHKREHSAEIAAFLDRIEQRVQL